MHRRNERPERNSPRASVAHNHRYPLINQASFTVVSRDRLRFHVQIDHKWQDGVCSAVDVALLGRFYERFADHAVEIGKRVVFEATGGLPDHKQMA